METMAGNCPRKRQPIILVANLGVAAFTLWFAQASAETDCESIQDAHAYNYCLAAQGPAYRPRNSKTPTTPGDEGPSVPPPYAATPNPPPVQRLTPLYPRYLNTTPRRPNRAPRHLTPSIRFK